MNTTLTAAQPLDADLIAKQVASWRAEIARLQDLIDHATGSTGAAQPLDLDDIPVYSGKDIAAIYGQPESLFYPKGDVDALIAQARAARPEAAADTTASASGDERVLFDSLYDANEFRREYDKYGPAEAAFTVFQYARATLAPIASTSVSAPASQVAAPVIGEQTVFAELPDVFAKLREAYRRGAAEQGSDAGEYKAAEEIMRGWDLPDVPAPVAAQQPAAKAPAAQQCPNCGRAPGERRDECEQCPEAPAVQAVTVRDMEIAQAVRRACVECYSPDDTATDYTEKMGDLNLSSTIRAASPASTPEASQQDAAVAAPSEPIAEKWAIYYDNLGKQPYESGFMQPWKLYDSEHDALEFEHITAPENYKPRRVFIYAAPTAAAATTSEDARDAARYRWLRDKSEPGICAFYLSVGQAFKNVKFAPETVDEAIDAQIAAMRATQQEGGNA